MANRKEQSELFKTIWDIANELRGAVDGWTFKAYVLGAIFYRYISEDICRYISKIQKEANEPDVDYSKVKDKDVDSPDFKEMMIAEKGYFIKPSQLFQNIEARADQDPNLNMTLANVFQEIEGTANGKESESRIKGLFSDFTVNNSQIGNTVEIRNKLLAKVLHKVKSMELNKHIENNSNDVFGDAYEFLMKMYASQAGKSGGEFFTPQEVSELLAQIAAYGTENIKSVYDPCCGSGSLLLKFQKIHGTNRDDLRYYGQEINPTTYNLCRINMFLHHVNYSHFDIALDDTLLMPCHIDMVEDPKVGAFDCIVSNPPYSLKWIGKENPLLMNDPRFAEAGVLAPASAADLAFTLHMYYHLKNTGVCAIVEFPGVLYRGGAEKQIRKYLLKENAIDTVIQLPANLFFGVGIATCIIVLKKQGRRMGDSNVLFIDASKEFVKEGNKNVLTEENQNNIFEWYKNRKDVQYVCKLVPVDDIIKNDCTLSVSAYVDQEDTREKIDIAQVNEQVRSLVEEGHTLNMKIEEIIKELGE